MVWAAKTTAGSQAAIDNSTEEFLLSTGLALNPGETAHIQLEVDIESTSITDALEIRVYGTLDDATEDWDEHAFQSFAITPTTTGAEDVSFLVSGLYTFRLGFLSAGATDTYTVGGHYRLNGISA